MNLVEVVDAALLAAKLGATKLPESVLNIKGHGSRAISIFFNELCYEIPDCRYLEFGTFAGRSLAAAAYKNPGTYRGVDRLQWLGSSVTFESVQDLKLTLASSIALCIGSNIGVTESDFRRFPPEPADVFFYDADHGLEATRDGIAMMIPHLKPGVLIVDDYVSHQKSTLVQQGTMDALANAEVSKSWTLTGKGWHTGIYVAVIG